MALPNNFVSFSHKNSRLTQNKPGHSTDITTKRSSVSLMSKLLLRNVRTRGSEWVGTGDGECIGMSVTIQLQPKANKQSSTA